MIAAYENGVQELEKTLAGVPDSRLFENATFFTSDPSGWETSRSCA